MQINASLEVKTEPDKVLPGNRPSSILVLERIDPEQLGALIAMYEHKVYVQSVLWGINAFDQWGGVGQRAG